MNRMYDEQLERKQIWEENLKIEKNSSSNCQSPFQFNYSRPIQEI